MDIYLLIEGQQQGPYTEDQVRQSLADGQIPNDTPAWYDGLPDWVQVQVLVEPHQLNVGSDLEATVESPQIPVGKERKRIGMAVGIGIGLFFSILIGTTVFALAILHKNSTVTTKVLSANEPASSQVAIPVSAPTVSDTQGWLKQKIEASGIRIQFQHDRRDNHVTRFSNVSLDNGIISYDEETRYFRNDSGLGFSLSHTDSDHREIDLTKIQPDSFKLSEQSQDADETEDGKPGTSYSIQCVPNNLSPVLYFDDKDIAQRVIKALNFLSEHVDHPPAKPEPF